MQEIAFSITCPYCKQKLKCPAHVVGAKRPCPGCHRQFFIPFPEAVPVEQEQSNGEIATHDGNWEFTTTDNSIDDVLIRSATLVAIEEKAELQPQLNCRTKLRGCSVAQEVFVSFPSKVFSIRDELPPARIRVDGDEPLTLPISTSETGNACFFQSPDGLITRWHEARRVLIELRLLRHGTTVFEFDARGFATIYDKLIAGAVEGRLQQLKDLNPEIVDYVLRIGPKNLNALIEVLCKSRFLEDHQIEKARRKDSQLFAAAQAFAERHHAGEIYGYAEGSRLNDPFSILVYNALTASTRSLIGKLTIFE